MMPQGLDDGLHIGVEVVNILIYHLNRKTSPEIVDGCGEVFEGGGMEGGHMILERSPQLLDGVQLWRSWWELEKAHSFRVTPLSDHPRFLLSVVVLDEKPSPRVALSCSREDVLRKQISIALRCQLPLEDGDAAGASARNCAKDKGLWTTRGAFEPLILDLLPLLAQTWPRASELLTVVISRKMALAQTQFRLFRHHFK